MRLSKTQRELISAAALHNGKYAIEAGSGRGPAGGRVSYGARERAAKPGVLGFYAASIDAACNLLNN